jgi:uncharacterized DUF497 family protein/uncharacterized protein (DUF4415 family)
MGFEWDAAKNAANIAKHEINFDDAIRIFDGPVLEKADTRRDYGEARIIAFGVVDDCELAVVYTMRSARRRIIYRRGEHIVVSAKNIVRRTPSSRRRGKTDWMRVGAISDDEIEKAVKADPDAAPILDKEWFRTAKLVLPERKVPISLRMDREVVEWFKAHGRRYQSRMNAVLKAYVQAHRKAG